MPGIGKWLRKKKLGIDIGAITKDETGQLAVIRKSGCLFFLLTTDSKGLVVFL